MTKKTTKNLRMKTPKKMMNKEIVDKMVRDAGQNKKMMGESYGDNVAQQQFCGLSAESRPSPMGLLSDIPRKTFTIQIGHSKLGCLVKNCYSQTELVDFIKELSFVDINYLQIVYR